MFKGLFPVNFANLPMIHCYTFIRNDEGSPEELAKQSVQQVLGTTAIKYDQIYNVRNVAPKKDMYCISFELPASVAYFQSESKRKYTEEEREVEEKKIRTE